MNILTNIAHIIIIINHRHTPAHCFAYTTTTTTNDSFIYMHSIHAIFFSAHFLSCMCVCVCFVRRIKRLLCHRKTRTGPIPSPLCRFFRSFVCTATTIKKISKTCISVYGALRTCASASAPARLRIVHTRRVDESTDAYGSTQK